MKYPIAILQSVFDPAQPLFKCYEAPSPRILREGPKRNMYDSRHKRQSHLLRRKPPLLIYRRIRLQEREDQRIAKSRKERQAKYDRFPYKHLKGPDPRFEYLSGIEPFAERPDFVGSIDVLSLCSKVFGVSVEEDGRAGFGDEDEVEELGGGAEDELDPADPFPESQSGSIILIQNRILAQVQGVRCFGLGRMIMGGRRGYAPAEICLDEGTCDWPNYTTEYTGENNVCNGKLLLIRVVKVGD